MRYFLKIIASKDELKISNISCSTGLLILMFVKSVIPIIEPTIFLVVARNSWHVLNNRNICWVTFSAQSSSNIDLWDPKSESRSNFINFISETRFQWLIRLFDVMWDFSSTRIIKKNVASVISILRRVKVVDTTNRNELDRKNRLSYLTAQTIPLFWFNNI